MYPGQCENVIFRTPCFDDGDARVCPCKEEQRAESLDNDVASDHLRLASFREKQLQMSVRPPQVGESACLLAPAALAHDKVDGTHWPLLMFSSAGEVDTGRSVRTCGSREVFREAFPPSGVMPDDKYSNIESAYPRRHYPDVRATRSLPQFEAILVGKLSFGGAVRRSYASVQQRSDPPALTAIP